MEIDLEIIDGHWSALPEPDAVVRAAVKAVCAVTGASNGKTEVAVRLAGDDEVAELNGTWRDKPYATNVLAFPTALTALVPDMPQSHGDIILAGGVVEREAREQGKSLESHTSHLVAHGMLHLLGYDHDDDQSAREMEALEKQVMARLGFSDPYQISQSQANIATGAGKPQ